MCVCVCRLYGRLEKVSGWMGQDVSRGAHVRSASGIRHVVDAMSPVNETFTLHYTIGFPNAAKGHNAAEA